MTAAVLVLSGACAGIMLSESARLLGRYLGKRDARRWERYTDEYHNY